MLKQRTISALRVLRKISDGPQTAKEIGQSLGLATSYIEQLCAVLAMRMGIMSGKRGRGGGYILAKELDSIDLSDLHSCLYDVEPDMRIPLTVNNALRFLAPEETIQRNTDYAKARESTTVVA